MKVLAFGEILWDIIENEEHLGGAPFNFSAHCVKCGAEVTSIISRVGQDILGKRAYNRVIEYGVDDSLIQWDDEYPTGIVDVHLKNGQPDYFIKEHVAYDFIAYNQQLKETINTMANDVFYFGSLAQRNSVSQTTLSDILKYNSFKHVFYDVNLRKNGYSKSVLEFSLSACTILKLNVEEVSVISILFFGNNSLSMTEFCIIMVQLYTINTIVITAAEEGCYVFERVINVLHKIDGQKIQLTDAVGAGDAFSASFMCEYLKHGNVIKAATKANLIGAFVASQKGPIPEYSNEIKISLAI
jgi:fructokinase